MVTFTVHSASELALFIVPLTEDGAIKIYDFMGTKDSVYAAVYGKGRDGKDGKWAICLSNYSDYQLCSLNEYHPRKDGKAEIIIREV